MRARRWRISLTIRIATIRCVTVYDVADDARCTVTDTWQCLWRIIFHLLLRELKCAETGGLESVFPWFVHQGIGRLLLLRRAEASAVAWHHGVSAINLRWYVTLIRPSLVRTNSKPQHDCDNNWLSAYKSFIVFILRQDVKLPLPTRHTLEKS